jgi:hypothetical protein
VCSLPESFDPEIGQRPLGDGMANLPVISASLRLGQLALISIFLNQILSGFKLISVIKNQIVMRGETGGFSVSVNLFTALKMQN